MTKTQANVKSGPVRLLSTKGLMRKLGGLSITKFQKLEPQLIASGVKVLQIGRQKRYLESSVDELILRMIENEESF